MSKNVQAIVACCVLHNFLKDENDGVTAEDRAEWAALAAADFNNVNDDEYDAVYEPGAEPFRCALFIAFSC